MDKRVARLLKRCGADADETALHLELPDPAAIHLNPAPPYVWHAIRAWCANEREDRKMELPEDLALAAANSEIQRLKVGIASIGSFWRGEQRKVAMLQKQLDALTAEAQPNDDG